MAATASVCVMVRCVDGGCGLGVQVVVAVACVLYACVCVVLGFRLGVYVTVAVAGVRVAGAVACVSWGWVDGGA